MSSSDSSISTTIANSADFCPVTICFQDPSITLLFAELLAVRGVEVRMVSDLREIDASTKIITEPYYFPHIPANLRPGCLIVGNHESLQGVEALHLARPLTEEKVESTLNQFLKA